MTPAPGSLAKVKPTRRERASEKASEKVSGLDIGIAGQDPINAIPAEMGIVIEAHVALAATAKGRTAEIEASDRIAVIQPVR
jgi:hypothetical protein